MQSHWLSIRNIVLNCITFQYQEIFEFGFSIKREKQVIVDHKGGQDFLSDPFWL